MLLLAQISQSTTIQQTDANTVAVIRDGEVIRTFYGIANNDLISKAIAWTKDKTPPTEAQITEALYWKKYLPSLFDTPNEQELPSLPDIKDKLEQLNTSQLWNVAGGILKRYSPDREECLRDILTELNDFYANFYQDWERDFTQR